MLLRYIIIGSCYNETKKLQSRYKERKCIHELSTNVCEEVVYKVIFQSAKTHTARFFKLVTKRFFFFNIVGIRMSVKKDSTGTMAPDPSGHRCF